MIRTASDAPNLLEPTSAVRVPVPHAGTLAPGTCWRKRWGPRVPHAFCRQTAEASVSRLRNRDTHGSPYGAG